MIKELSSENEVIWDRWSKNAERAPDRDAIVHWVAGEEPFRWTFSALIDAAEELAAMLVERDIGKGDVCAIIMRHNKILYPLYLAIVCGERFLAALHIRIRVCILINSGKVLTVCLYARVSIGLSLNATLRKLFVLLPLEKPDSTIKGLHFPWNETGHALTKEQLHRVITRHNMVNHDDPFVASAFL